MFFFFVLFDAYKWLTVISSIHIFSWNISIYTVVLVVVVVAYNTLFSVCAEYDRVKASPS